MCFYFPTWNWKGCVGFFGQLHSHFIISTVGHLTNQGYRNDTNNVRNSKLSSQQPQHSFICLAGPCQGRCVERYHLYDRTQFRGFYLSLKGIRTWPQKIKVVKGGFSLYLVLRLIRIIWTKKRIEKHNHNMQSFVYNLFFLQTYAIEATNRSLIIMKIRWWVLKR